MQRISRAVAARKLKSVGAACSQLSLNATLQKRFLLLATHKLLRNVLNYTSITLFHRSILLLRYFTGLWRCGWLPRSIGRMFVWPTAFARYKQTLR